MPALPFPLIFGLDTFGDVTHDENDRPLSHAQSIRNLVEQGVHADQVGIDFFGIGEHHTDDFPLSAADVVLAAIAARTTRLHVGSAVTVLSSDDPVRVFQRYSTLNAVSDGRAEVILGRGSSIESFPLFGYDLADYEDLFEEKVDLFAELLRGGPVTWQGKTRPALKDQDVVPHTESGPFPVWIGVEGDHVVFFTQPASRKARNLECEPRVAISLVDLENPYLSAQLRGRVVGTVEGEEALEIIDRLAVKYTGEPFPMRSGVVFLVEPERARSTLLPFRHEHA